MSDIYQALQDVKWLSERLKGLISLSEEIESYDNLKQQTSEMQKALEQKKAEYQDWEEKTGNVKDEWRVSNERHEMEVSANQAKIDGMLAKAEADSNGILTQAKQKAEELRTEVEKERQAYLLKNKDLQETSMSLSKEIASKEKQLEGLKASLAQIKASF